AQLGELLGGPQRELPVGVEDPPRGEAAGQVVGHRWPVPERVDSFRDRRPLGRATGCAGHEPDGTTAANGNLPVAASRFGPRRVAGLARAHATRNTARQIVESCCISLNTTAPSASSMTPDPWPVKSMSMPLPLSGI